MFGISLYEGILGLSSSWHISNASLNESSDCLEIKIGTSSGAEFSCPVCNGRTNMVGSGEHRWRHDNLFSRRLRIVASIPLISCEICGVNRVKAPWERPGSNFREGDVDEA